MEIELYDHETGELYAFDDVEVPVIGIGRGLENQVIIPAQEQRISRKHCEISLHPFPSIVDCGSTNGTIVYNKKGKDYQEGIQVEGKPVILTKDALIRLGYDSGEDESPRNLIQVIYGLEVDGDESYHAPLDLKEIAEQMGVPLEKVQGLKLERIYGDKLLDPKFGSFIMRDITRRQERTKKENIKKFIRRND